MSKFNDFKSKKEKKKNDEEKAAKSKGNEQWISENAQDWIDKITSKLDEFDKEIDKLNQKQSITL